MGKTTNQLITLADQASRGDGHGARKTLSALQDLHFQIAGETVHGAPLSALELSLQHSFRELHGIIRDLSEEGAKLTPALSDHVMSFGERLSSEIVAAALASHMPAVHADSRSFILTDSHHGSAAPLLWESYARLRRRIPYLAADNVVVMGGFIGSTEDGVTTTLGRGGSDYSASIIGAAINAEEIQIWTDVDGMLSCDPRVLPVVYRVRSISYQEATVMAGRGAKVLHPETTKPAIRQRIPLVIRNSRRPENEGTRIAPVADPCANAVKTIAVKENLLLLEMRSPGLFQDLCYRKGIEPALLVQSGKTLYAGLNNDDMLKLGSIDSLPVEFTASIEVRLHRDVAWVSLIGEGVRRECNLAGRALYALRHSGAKLVASNASPIALSLIVPQSEVRRSCRLLHEEFFAYADRNAFAPYVPEEKQKPELHLPLHASERFAGQAGQAFAGWLPERAR
jgi:aspartate kinase